MEHTRMWRTDSGHVRRQQYLPGALVSEFNWASTKYAAGVTTNVWVVAEEHALQDGVGIRPQGLPCKRGSSEIFFDDMLERDY
jgi:hypothetical protein